MLPSPHTRVGREPMLREQQAASLSYFDIFWVAAMLSFVLVMLVFFMKRSVAEKDAHVGAE